MPNDRDSLTDIVLACRRVLEYMHGRTRVDLLRDPMLQDAVIRRIEVIGEATKRLSNEFRDSYAAIPWQQMAGMRDRLSHGYDKVDVERVW